MLISLLIVVAAIALLFINDKPNSAWGGAGLRRITGFIILIVSALLAARGGFVIAGPAFLFGSVLAGGGWLRQLLGLPGGGPARSQSGVTTKSVHMTLDRAGTPIDGYVQRGPFAGKRLSALSEEELASFWGDCELSDPDAAQLIGAFVEARKARARGRASGSSGAGRGDMDLEEACEILGLGPNPTEGEVQEAYKRLIQALHPDKHGTDYLASKINAARDALMARLQKR